MNKEQFGILLNSQFLDITKQEMITIGENVNVVSGCLIFEADNIMIMGSVYTVDEKRRKGYAQMVLDKVKKIFHSSNKKVLIATVETNTFIEKFYLKNGFSIVGSYDGNESIIIMNK